VHRPGAGGASQEGRKKRGLLTEARKAGWILAKGGGLDIKKLTGEERQFILPPLRELQTVRRLKITITWSEYRDMPEDLVAVWDAIVEGEQQAQREQAASAQ
jgi:hypothetical protein